MDTYDLLATTLTTLLFANLLSPAEIRAVKGRARIKLSDIFRSARLPLDFLTTPIIIQA